MDSVSEENVVKIMEDKKNMTKDVDELSIKTDETIWLRELDVLEQHHGVYKKRQEELQKKSRKNHKAVVQRRLEQKNIQSEKISMMQ